MLRRIADPRHSRQMAAVAHRLLDIYGGVVSGSIWPRPSFQDRDKETARAPCATFTDPALTAISCTLHACAAACRLAAAFVTAQAMSGLLTLDVHTAASLGAGAQRTGREAVTRARCRAQNAGAAAAATRDAGANHRVVSRPRSGCFMTAHPMGHAGGHSLLSIADT